MERKRARIIYNPSSGKEILRNHLPDMLDILENGGFETSCHATKGSEDTMEAARQASFHQFDLVVAAGGDGTINEVINGLSRCEYRPPLGIIPAGTTNDLGRALRLPRHPIEACKVIIEQNYVPLDVGKVTAISEEMANSESYFINIAACGRLTEISYEVPSKLKTILGQLAYYMKGFEKLPQIRPIHLDLDSPEYSFSGKVMLCLIANSSSVAGFHRIAPDAKIDDGVFDVLLVKTMSIPELIRLATLALRGEHIASDRIDYFHTNHLVVKSDEQVDLNLDGEYGGALPRQFQVLKHHLQVAVKNNIQAISGNESDSDEMVEYMIEESLR
ncbi:diacylglycerol kinase [Fodinisporobacter ferrooxydans]|uniref:Diacylglycerol kinase n=1 Tax=Fodinisporobacter ferrooxydans TaxID=2901836 RepID=A0ABY4CP46_9BACL|nr:diacylglycerol kinase [Alicyclobacillaceae bacterium MYW30-H2]